MHLKYLGHSSFLAEISGYKVLFDPFLTGNPKSAVKDIKQLEADYILVSHGHGDHVADVEAIARKTGALIISNFEIVSWYENKGLRGHPMNFGGKKEFDFGFVKYVVATHSSGLPDGSYGGDPGGFVIWNSEISFYFAGDTAVHMDMQLIPKLCPKLDFAILPVGDNFTMGVEDALVASDLINCNEIVGCHFDTFEVIEIDHKSAKQSFKNQGKNLILMTPGESREF